LFQPESRDGEEENDPQQVEEQMTQEHLIQRPFYYSTRQAKVTTVKGKKRHKVFCCRFI
jgi:hypothetical protein